VPVRGGPPVAAATMSFRLTLSALGNRWPSGTLAASVGQIKQTYRLAVGAVMKSPLCDTRVAKSVSYRGASCS
jgi:hypothetical protein